ncbi:MAG: hypothetical protein R3C45_11040 [Phycisphaerales bacterium]
MPSGARDLADVVDVVGHVVHRHAQRVAPAGVAGEAALDHREVRGQAEHTIAAG